MTEIRERPPSTQTMSMEGPLGGGAGDPGVPTINTKNVDDGPPGGGARDLGASTNNTKNIDGGPPWEVMPEIQEHPPLTQKTSTVDPLGGGARDPRAPTINAKKYQRGPLGPHVGSSLHPGFERCVVNLHGQHE
jgi:hypothetical protein